MRSPVVEKFCYRCDDYNEDIDLVQYLNNGTIRALVGDGVAEYHSPSKPRRIVRFCGDYVDSAQLVGRLVVKHILGSPAGLTLKELFQHANGAVGVALAEQNFPMDVAADLPGLDVSAVQIKGNDIELVQCGDSLAMWQNVDDTCSGTRNQVFDLEMDRRPLVWSLREQGISGGSLWDHPEWERLYRQHREMYKNRPGKFGNATINGQPGFNDLLYWVGLSRERVRRLLLITDGFVEYEETGNVPQLAEKLFWLYDEVGLRGIAETKGLDRIKEATAIMIDWG